MVVPSRGVVAVRLYVATAGSFTPTRRLSPTPARIRPLPPPAPRPTSTPQHRHLCEFHGLDMEMAINEHYSEVLDVFSDLFVYIFDGLNTRYK